MASKACKEQIKKNLVNWSAHEKELKQVLSEKFPESETDFIGTQYLLDRMQEEPAKYPLFNAATHRQGKSRLTDILYRRWNWKIHSTPRNGNVFIRGKIP